MSGPVEKRHPDYPVDSLQTQHNTTKKTRKNQEREAKTNALVKKNLPYGESKTANKNLPIKTKQELPQEQADNQASKKRKSHTTKPLEATASASGTNPFAQLPKDVRKLILQNLSQKDQQSARVDRMLNQDVIEFNRGNTMLHLARFTECLMDNLPDMHESLKTPQALAKALQTHNLEEFQQALYDARSRLIDILTPLEPAKLTELAEAYKKTGFSLPTKFEHIFEIITTLKSSGKQSLMAPTEWYELARHLHKSLPNVMPGLISHLLNGISDAKGFQLLAQMDKPTFILLEQVVNSLPNCPEKNLDFVTLHLHAAMRQIIAGLGDKSLESVKKALAATETLVSNLGHLDQEKYSKHAIYSRNIDTLAGAILLSNLDKSSIIKIFELFEKAANTTDIIIYELGQQIASLYKENGGSGKLSDKIQSTKIMIFAKMGFEN